jgi:hypothetical protein
MTIRNTSTRINTEPIFDETNGIRNEMGRPPDETKNDARNTSVMKRGNSQIMQWKRCRLCPNDNLKNPLDAELKISARRLLPG